MPHSTRHVDVALTIDSARFLGVPMWMTLFASLAMALDGLDVQAMAFAAPVLVTEWRIERAALGYALGAGLIGMCIGAFAFGWIGDRWGRRVPLIGCIFLFAMGSFACATASDLRELTVLRFLTGLGLGGPLALCPSLMGEFVPVRRRSLAVGAAIVGFPLGGMIGAVLARELIPQFGWPAIFIAGGVLPLLLLAVLLVALPESPKFLAGQPGRGSQLAELLNRIVKEQRFDGTEQFFVAEPTAARGSIPALFRAPFTTRTMFLWLAFLGNIFAAYAFFNWLPTVLAAAGLPVTAASTGSFAFNFGGVVVALLVAAVLNRFGSRVLIPVFAIVSIVSTYALGQQAVFTEGAAASTTGLYVLAAIAGGAITAVQVALYATATYVYPTVLRATGTGAATGVGRMGGILSAASGSVLFALGLAGTAFFTALAVVLICVLIAVIGLRDQIPATTRGAQIRTESTATQER